jgi:hypothetical protein
MMSSYQIIAHPVFIDDFVTGGLTVAGQGLGGYLVPSSEVNNVLVYICHVFL